MVYELILGRAKLLRRLLGAEPYINIFEESANENHDPSSAHLIAALHQVLIFCLVVGAAAKVSGCDTEVGSAVPYRTEFHKCM